jgi:hypothetical protein
MEGGLARGRFRGGVGDVESELAVAQQDLIAGLETGRAADFLSVELRAVLGCYVVQFAPQVGVNKYRTVPARDALITDDDIVIGEPADAVHPEPEWIDVGTVFEVKHEPPGRNGATG